MDKEEYFKGKCPKCDGHYDLPESISGSGIGFQCRHCKAWITILPYPYADGPIVAKGPSPELSWDYFSTSDGRIHGQFAKSPNKEFTLLWRDNALCLDARNTRTKGPFYLFKESHELCKGAIERPHDGHVADDGAFLFCDWLFTGESASVFYAFNCAGEVLVKKKFRANLLGASMSPGGEFAACQTVGNRNSRDGELLTLFDLRSHNVVWRLYPPFRAETYEFSVESNQLTICCETPNSIVKSAVLKLTPLPSRNRKPKATK
jgi:hypothetical protein